MNNKLLLILFVLFSKISLFSADLDISKVTSSSTEATKLLYKFAEDAGYTVTRFDDDSFKLTQGGLNLHVSIKSFESGLDRITAHVFFNGKKENTYSDKFAAVVNRINWKYSNCTVAYDEKNGGIVFRWHLYFDNKLSPKAFKQWIDLVIFGTDFILDKEPELSK